MARYQYLQWIHSSHGAVARSAGAPSGGYCRSDGACTNKAWSGNIPVAHYSEESAKVPYSVQVAKWVPILADTNCLKSSRESPQVDLAFSAAAQALENPQRLPCERLWREWDP